MSYISLIFSVYEINETAKEFPFGYLDDEKKVPMAINQRIKSGAYCLLWIYIGFSAVAMIATLSIFMKIESNDNFGHVRTKMTTFK